MDMSYDIETSIEVLERGGLILYPTDTVWALGCDATNMEAVERVYRLKRSTDKRSMIILCGSLEMAMKHMGTSCPAAFDALSRRNRPVTVIVPKGVGVADNLIPEDGSLAMRVPRHGYCEKLLRAFGRPIVSTSANLSGEPAAKSLTEISLELIDNVDYVTSSKMESYLHTNQPSMIIKFDLSGNPTVIRK